MSDEYATPDDFPEATRPPPPATRTMIIDGVPVQIEITKEDRATQTKVYFFCEEWLDRKVSTVWDRSKYYVFGITNALLLFLGYVIRGMR